MLIFKNDPLAKFLFGLQQVARKGIFRSFDSIPGGFRFKRIFFGIIRITVNLAVRVRHGYAYDVAPVFENENIFDFSGRPTALQKRLQHRSTVFPHVRQKAPAKQRYAWRDIKSLHTFRRPALYERIRFPPRPARVGSGSAQGNRCHSNIPRSRRELCRNRGKTGTSPSASGAFPGGWRQSSPNPLSAGAISVQPLFSTFPIASQSSGVMQTPPTGLIDKIWQLPSPHTFSKAVL